LKKLMFLCANCGYIRVGEYDILEEIEYSGGQPPCAKCGKSVWEAVPVEAD